ncbi:DUF1611 domain-containing protein [Leptolyngbya sp. NIES-2104]|uniref:DUF1611 domain-containing protein n=1 Tax=Leptolyngbya sp. NIES-2104 TaxID=1552121 RepID=UPI0006EC8200|nr:DUF1611 domain-containing protein [Leptolyngbya sp. NIES-2104]GAP97349.1 protein often near L-alanine-DL-glutamate epimerase [Leptolyngbya sp. NIES-2104]
MLQSSDRVAVLLHDGIQGTQGKTGLTFTRYRSESVVAIIDQQTAGQSFSALTSISCEAPIVSSMHDALSYQPTVLLIGIAPSGGILPEAWLGEIEQAIESGMSIVNGLHTALSPRFKDQLKPEQWIWDIRQEPPGLKVGSGAARSLSNLRILTVGTDMSIGKMSTSLELDRAAQKRGIRSKFLGTGQAGMMISGDGIPLDAIRVDFAAGAVEQLVMRYGDFDLLHVEGQGSIFNPASTATLPLLRGSQPTHLILVHRAGQLQIRTFPHVSIPPLKTVVQVYETLAAAGGSFTPCKVAAIALNTAHLDQDAAWRAIALIQEETNLPCTDPVRFGADILLDAILNCEPAR